MRRAPGFTILEMLIALAVSALAISAALLMAQSQQRSFHGGAKIRQAQGSARAALLYLEQKVPLAGYGLDPAEALDFLWYGCAGGPSSCPRDRTDGPDELVFYARNPAYRIVGDPTVHYGKAWKAVKVEGDLLTLEARAGDFFPKGQIYQLACGAEMRYTQVTIAQTKTAAAAGQIDLELDPVAPGDLAAGVNADPFRRQDAARSKPAPHPDFAKWVLCFSTAPNVFQIDRYRFYVGPIDMGGGRTDPYLVLDQGIDRDADGDIDLDDELLIAQGIENFQVSYGFLDPAIPAAGSTPGTAITVRGAGSTADAAAETITPTNFPGAYNANEIYPILHSSQFFTPSSAPLDPKRTTNDQGNIRSIQIAIVARSAEPDTAGFSNLGYTPGSRLWVMNFNALPAWIAPGDDQYARAVVTTTIQIPNTASRGLVAN